ncbi:BTAD domain-containing putative transcriptional regulator [Gordonia sp. L191]|uniref:BTAD domain-containing putative transcriptional regulator n=1 Tax=Gordonia sp. L191 TaxID=2982699 RepID=UPI0024C083EF|nr:BTAD domain-containing putative transcriptional regulator [Gordonia sp. L191]WHU49542.1 BTAD domain-containing putative transcriptional regulator [Gordonia sp. L191]
MPFEVRVLGALAVRVDGVEVPLGGPLPRALLSRLLIAGGEVVSASTIIDDLWHQSPPRTATGTLQAYVSTLRRVLEPAHAQKSPEVLVRTGSGYRLLIPRDAVDANVFVGQAQRGRALPASGEVAGAREILAQALAQWHGPAYSDIEGWEFAQIEATRLEAVRAAAVDDHLAASSACGDHESVIVDLSALLRADPLRERRWELLALTQYRAGRQAQALESLRTARNVLADEVGADPGPSLVALHDAILRHDPGLIVDAEHDAHVRLGRHVPVALTSFVGRDEDLADVEHALGTDRLVTLTGPGGIGKTRLAMAVAAARSDHDGPWFVEASGTRDHDSLVEATTRVLGFTARGGVDVLTSLLSTRRTLLVLDNCEHVAGDAAKLVLALLTACPGVQVLATSRVRLGVPGEHVHVVGPLHEAATLFTERAPRAARTEDPADIVTLCRALDNLPLAIELAAARTSMLSVRQLHHLLIDRFALLRTARAALPGAAGERHSSMYAAIEGSYRALDDSQRRLFEALTVFAGGFDHAAAEAVTGHGARLLGDLEALIDSSMVTVVGGDPRRYRILETLREFAVDHLDESRSAALQAAHLRWVRAMSAEVDAGLRGPDTLAWTRRLDAEMPNIHAALSRCRHADPAAYTQIVGGIFWYWYRRGRVDEGLRMLRPALTVADDPGIPVVDRLRALCGVLVIAYLAGDLDVLLDSMGRLEATLSNAPLDMTRRDDRLAHADAAVTLGFFQGGAGAVESGIALARGALSVATSDGLPQIAAEARMALGSACFRAGDHDAADDELAVAVELGRECGYDWLVASALWIGAKNDIARGRVHGPAQEKLTEMIAACERIDDLTSWMVAVFTLAYVEFVRGQHEAAARLLGVADHHGEVTGYRPERMDVIDLASYGREMTERIDAHVLDKGMATGRALDRAAVAVLIRERVASVGGTTPKTG